MRLTYPFSTSPGLRELYTTRKPPGGKGGQGVSDEEAEPGRYSGSGRYDVGHWLEDLDTFAGTWVAGWDGSPLPYVVGGGLGGPTLQPQLCLSPLMHHVCLELCLFPVQRTWPAATATSAAATRRW